MLSVISLPEMKLAHLAPVPNKVRNHVWRLAKNILPSKVNHSKKGILLDTTCPICNDGAESVDHMIMHCSVMKLSLFSSQPGTHIPNNLHYHSWLLHWLVGPEPLGAQIFVVTLWKVWQSRNQIVFKNIQPNPLHIAEAVREFVAEFNIANSPNQNGNSFHDNVANAPLSPNSHRGNYILLMQVVFVMVTLGEE